jgi:hypothetical protein
MPTGLKHKCQESDAAGKVWGFTAFKQHKIINPFNDPPHKHTAPQGRGPLGFRVLKTPLNDARVFIKGFLGGLRFKKPVSLIST